MGILVLAFLFLICSILTMGSRNGHQKFIFRCNPTHITRLKAEAVSRKLTPGKLIEILIDEMLPYDLTFKSTKEPQEIR